MLFNQQKVSSQQWMQIFGLGAAVSLLLQLVIIPIIRWAANQLLLAGKNPVVSISSGVRLVEQRPLIALGVFIELVLITLVVDWLIIIWVAGVGYISREIVSQQSLSEIVIILKRRWASAYWPALLMFLSFLPVFSLCFRTPLLVAGRAPIVFLDYVTRNKIVLTIGLVLYLVILMLAWRLKHVLVLIVVHDQSMREAMNDLHHQNVNKWRDLQNLLVMTGVSWLINGAL